MVRGLLTHLLRRTFMSSKSRGIYAQVGGMITVLTGKRLLGVINKLQPIICPDAEKDKDPGNIMTRQLVNRMRQISDEEREKTLKRVCGFVISDWFLRSSQDQQQLIFDELKMAAQSTS